MEQLGDVDPANQYLAPEKVISEMARTGARRAVERRWSEVLLLSVMAGGLITVGALFSTLIATGTDNEGIRRLLEGFGFSVGFFAVVLSGALLFTEVNVEMPATLLGGDARVIASRVARLWVLAGVGNLIGALVIGWAVTTSDAYPRAVAGQRLRGRRVPAQPGEHGLLRPDRARGHRTRMGTGPAVGGLPAAIGNVIGAFVLVALPFWYLDQRPAAR